MTTKDPALCDSKTPTFYTTDTQTTNLKQPTKTKKRNKMESKNGNTQPKTVKVVIKKKGAEKKKITVVFGI